MILIAPDKFKGTFSAKEAAALIAEAIRPKDYIKAPMADGGEGTAEILCRGLHWEKRDCYYVERRRKTAVIDSSAVIGLHLVDPASDILRRTSYPLGEKVREILKSGCEKVIIGIGGTATCDGGLGFIEGLGREKISTYKNSIVGLSDVRVPLVAPLGEPSALMFARQKGATNLDIDVLHRRLTALREEYPTKTSPFDGAGGGLGFAIASIIGAPCHDGAKYVIDSYGIDWPKVSMIITGEGKIDLQTRQGKVVDVLMQKGKELNIPVIAIGGTVEECMRAKNIISTTDFYPDLPFNKNTAARRLMAAAKSIYS